MQFNVAQQRRAVELIEAIPVGGYGPTGPNIRTSARARAESDGEGVSPGEEEGAARFKDEFSVTPDEVNKMSPEWKLAYVGRLVRFMALAYGVHTGDFGPGPASARGGSELACWASPGAQRLVGAARQGRAKGLKRQATRAAPALAAQGQGARSGVHCSRAD